MLLAVFLVSFPIVVIGLGVLLGLIVRLLTRRKETSHREGPGRALMSVYRCSVTSVSKEDSLLSGN